MTFNKTTLLDVSVSEGVLEEQVSAFIEEGHTGSDLVRLIMRSHKSGIANHVSRILSILKEYKSE